MPHHICITCAVQFRDSPEPPSRCPICEDERQYVPAEGQRWTTLPELRVDHRNRIAPQADLLGVGTEPEFGIGQRALLVPHGDANVLWDCVALLDDDTARRIDERGGLSAIAISHPHYYATMVEWARRFRCPILLHAADSDWVMRPDPAVEHWAGATLDLGHGLTLIRTGGHFPGATVLHHARGSAGRGNLLVGDVALTVPDRDHLTFMWSYPNQVPLHADDVRRIADAIAPFSYETLQTAFWDGEVRDAERVVERSVRRYVEHVTHPRSLPAAYAGAGERL